MTEEQLLDHIKRTTSSLSKSRQPLTFKRMAGLNGKTKKKRKIKRIKSCDTL